MCVHIRRGSCKRRRRRILTRNGSSSSPSLRSRILFNTWNFQGQSQPFMCPVGYGLRRSSAGPTKSDGWDATIRGYQFKTPWRIIHLVHLGSRVKPTSCPSPPPLDHLASRQNRNAHYFVSRPKFTSEKSVGSVTTPPFFPGHQRQMRRVVYGG